MSKITTLVFTYNEIPYYKDGSYGDGRVAIHIIDPSVYTDESASAFDILFESSFVEILEGDVFDKAFIYVGRLTEKNVRYLNACLRVATGLIEDRAMIHLVSCNCGIDKVKPFCHKSGFTYVPCECSGMDTLQRIVDGILGEVDSAEAAEP